MAFTTTTRTVKEGDSGTFEMLVVNAQSLIGNTGDIPPYVMVFDDGGTPTIVATASPLPVTGTVIATPSGTQGVSLPARAEIAGLSFVETLGALGAHTTSWVEVDGYEWLSFTSEVASASAITGLVEFTDAADPNTTPPGASDVVKSFTQSIGGTALGAPSNQLTFSFSPPLRWCRVTATDVTGGQSVQVTTFGSPLSASAAILPIAASVTNDFGAALVQSVTKAEDPGGTYRALRFSEKVAEQSSTAAISAAGSFTGSEWTPLRGYTGAAIFIKSAANSATNGIKLQISFDSGTTGHYEDVRTYGAAPDGRVYKFAVPYPGAHGRVVVTAGGSDMTSLQLHTYLLSQQVEDVSIPLDDVVEGGMVADLFKGQIIGNDSGGTWHNMEFSTAGNPRMSIAQHEVDTPIKALDGAGVVAQKSVIAANSIRLDSGQADRKTISIYVDEDNTDDIYYGYASGVTTSTGFKMVAGQAKEWEIGPNFELHAISASGTQKIFVDEVS